MPKYCKRQARDFSDNEMISGMYASVCEVVIPFFGIDAGSDDFEYFYIFYDSFAGMLDPDSCAFQVVLFFAACVLAFMIGVYIR